MRNRHLHAQLRRSAATVGVAAAAVMASAFTLAPAALADDVPDPGTTTEPTTPPATDPPPADTPPPPDSTEDPTETQDPADPPADPAPGAASSQAPAATPKKVAPARPSVEAVEPDYGIQKVRIGVQIADGSWVPDGTNTVGTKIRITESGPNIEGGSFTTECTTEASTVEPPSTASYCVFDEPEVSRLSKAARIQAATVEPDPGGPGGQYVVFPGDSITVEQVTVNDNLLRDTSTPTVGPCEVDSCPDLRVLFNDPGIPPEAADDDTCVDPGVPVNIDVLANDDTVNGAPLTDLEVTSDPAQGNAAVTGSGDNRRIRFSPNANFDGTSSFDYRITTPNGNASATVEITRCPEPTGVLPDTGGDDPRILGTGLALIVGGGALVLAGGRRRRELRVVD